MVGVANEIVQSVVHPFTLLIIEICTHGGVCSSADKEGIILIHELTDRNIRPNFHVEPEFDTHVGEDLTPQGHDPFVELK